MESIVEIILIGHVNHETMIYNYCLNNQVIAINPIDIAVEVSIRLDAASMSST